MRFTFALYLLLLTLTLLSCRSAPKHDQEVKQTQANEAEKYWSWNNVPHLKKHGFNKIVVPEFNVEFVTHKAETILKSQAIINPLAFTPYGRGAQILGMGKKTVEFSEDLRQQVCQLMYQQFLAALKKQGFDPVPLTEIVGSKSYQKLERSGPNSSVFSAFEPNRFGHWSR